MQFYKEINSFDGAFVERTKINNMFKEIYSGELNSPNYVSQATGWRITRKGEGDFRYLFADEMHVKSFVADLEQALAGGQRISKSVAKIATPFVIPAAGDTAYLVVEEFAGFTGHVFADGDMIGLQQMTRSGNTSVSVAYVWGTVAYASRNAAANPPTQSYVFTRSAAPNAGTGSGTIMHGSLALDYGISGNGYYEVTAIDGTNGSNSPYAQVVNWTTHPNSGSVVKGRFGNLNGITSSTWGALTGKWGIFLDGDAYLENAHVHGVITVTAGSNIEVGATVGATWGTNLSNIPATLGAPAGSGLFLSADHMGYYASGAWKTYTDNFGNVIYGDIAGGNQGLSWNQGTGALSIKGTINITGSGNAATQSYANDAAGAAQTAAESYAAGAASTAQSNAISTAAGDATSKANAAQSAAQSYADGLIPATIKAPSGNGLFLSSTYMGYYASGAWKTYTDNSGNVIYGDVAGGNAGLSWNQSAGTLMARGTFYITGGTTIPTNTNQLTDGANLGGTAAWSGISSVPSFLSATAPDNSLAMTSSFFGFHATGSTWPIKIANDSGVGKFYAGNGSTKYMSYDGTDLAFVGGAVSIGSSNDIFKADSNGIYLGNATFASAPFSVTMAGAMTATSATLKTSTGTKYIDIGIGIANEIQFFEGSASKVRIGSSIYSTIPGIFIDGGDIMMENVAAGAGLQIQGTTVTQQVSIFPLGITIASPSGSYTLSSSGYGLQVDSGINIPTGSTYKINGTALTASNVGAEAALGNPGTDGYVLSSTTAGVRSWVAPGAGSMVYPGAGIALSTGSAWGTSIANNSASWDGAASWVDNYGYTDYLRSGDIYAWAKAATKPSYTYSEVGAAASGHNHTGVYLPVSGAGDIYTHNASEFAAAFSGVGSTIAILKSGGGVYELTFSNGILTQINEP